jgi:hypothetical protein
LVRIAFLITGSSCFITVKLLPYTTYWLSSKVLKKQQQFEIPWFMFVKNRTTCVLRCSALTNICYMS